MTFFLRRVDAEKNAVRVLAALAGKKKLSTEQKAARAVALKCLAGLAKTGQLVTAAGCQWLSERATIENRVSLHKQAASNSEPVRRAGKRPKQRPHKAGF